MTHLIPARLAPGAAALTLCLAMTGCADQSRPQGSGAYPLQVEDCGQSITISSEPASVLTIGTAAVELLDAAGASSRITARSGEFGAPLPDGLRTPPSDDLIINPADPTTEEILAVAPDLVLGYGLFNADAQQLKDAGITVLTVQGECGHDGTGTDAPSTSLSTVIDDVERLGRVVGTSQDADAAAAALRTKAEAARRSSTGQSAAWVYYFSSEDSLSAYGGRGMSASLLTEAGLDNTYAQETDAYITVSVESLLERQPHWIVLTYGLYGESEEEARAKFLAEPGVQALTAVAQGRVVLLPASASSAGPAAVSGLEELVSLTDG